MLILVGIVIVEGSKILDVGLEDDVLALAGLQQFGLAEGDEVHCRFFDSAIGIGGGVVKLDDVFAAAVAGVGDFDGDGDVVILLGEVSVDRDDFLLEGGVGETMAEWINDVVLIPFFARFAHVGGNGFVVTITHVDAFGIVDHHVVGVGESAVFAKFQNDGAVAVAIRRFIAGVDGIVGLAVVAEVIPSGVGLEVPHVEVDGVARGVDGAGQDAADGHDAVIARLSDPKHRIDGCIVFDVAKFHDRGAVEDDDDLPEVELRIGEHFAFGIGQGHIVLVGVAMAALRVQFFQRIGLVGHGGVREVIRAFGTGPGDDDDRRVIVNIEVGVRAFEGAVIGQFVFSTAEFDVASALFDFVHVMSQSDGVAAAHAAGGRRVRFGRDPFFITSLDAGVVLDANGVQGIVKGAFCASDMAAGRARSALRARSAAAGGEVDGLFT